MDIHTKEMKHRVKIVIPIYHDRLDDYERISLSNNLKILGAGERYPVVFLLPEGIAAPPETDGYPVIRVSDEWLGCRNGIAGYNRMMMSGEFYDMFTDCDYILICQTDVWIFRDELGEWCDKGFDYVGAPWPKRAVYDTLPLRLWLGARKALCGRNGRILRQDCFNRIGNGGLSLRKVESHRRVCRSYADRIAEFNRHSDHLHNEDVFWAIIPDRFRYPTVEEALGFSFDVKPDYCYRLAGGKLPFGCHGWYKKRLREFWKAFLPL